MKPRTWGDLYEAAVSVGLAGMCLYAIGNSAVPGMLVDVEQQGHSPGWVSVSAFLLVVSGWLGGWYFFGPLALSSPALQWLVWRRHPGAWLRRERTKVLAVAAVLAAVIAVTAGMALSAAGSPSVIPGLVVWAVLVLLVACTIRVQRFDLDTAARLAPGVLGVAGVTVAAAAAWTWLVAAIVGCCLTIGLVVARPTGTVLSNGGAELTPRWQLHRAARSRRSAGASVALLDGEVIRIARHREAKASKRLLPLSVYRLPRPANLALAVLVRSLRTVLAATVFALPLALAVHELLGPVPAVTIVVVLEFFVAVSMNRGAETWLTSDALPRIWMARGARVPIALATPAMAVCLVIVAIMTFALSLSPIVSLVLVVLPGAVLLRRRSVRSGETGMTLVATPMGAVSLQTLNRVTAGPDMVLVSLFLIGWLM